MVMEMTKLIDRPSAGTLTASAPAWLLAIGGLTGLAPALPELGVTRSVFLALACGSPPLALWLRHRASDSRRLGIVVPPTLLAHRYHGRLNVITDSERRALRPIGNTAYQVAARTGMLLADLVA